MRTFAAAVALGLASVASAQSTVPPLATVPAIDPARLAAATDLVDAVNPPAQREAMIGALMSSMTRNMAVSMGADFAERRANDPRIGVIYDRFTATYVQGARKAIIDALPGMVEALRRAYARRFTVEQMAEMRAFFASPTGRLYMDQGPTIMNDPDVAAWQRTVMTAQLARMREQTRAMQLEILALPEKPE